MGEGRILCKMRGAKESKEILKRVGVDLSGCGRKCACEAKKGLEGG